MNNETRLQVSIKLASLQTSSEIMISRLNDLQAELDVMKSSNAKRLENIKQIKELLNINI